MPKEEQGLAQRRRLNGALGLRRLHLAKLDAAIVADPHGLACGVVPGALVLKVIRVDHPSRSVEVGSSRVGGRWWYRVKPGGEGVVPVDEVERAPQVLAGILDRETDR